MNSERKKVSKHLAPKILIKVGELETVCPHFISLKKILMKKTSLMTKDKINVTILGLIIILIELIIKKIYEKIDSIVVKSGKFYTYFLTILNLFEIILITFYRHLNEV